MRVWIIADTHFEHSKLSKELKVRPDYFENRIVTFWKRNVSKDDLVIHLGDVFVGHTPNWEKWIPSLPGRKILTVGNHDKKSYTWYMKHGFDFASQSFRWKHNGISIAFSHEPMLNDAYFNLNIHGHMHGETHRTEKLTERHYLISLEKQGYKLQHLKTVIRDWEKSKIKNKKEKLICD